MTQSLSYAFKKASLLSTEIQDVLAQEIIDEIEAEAQWDTTLVQSADKLEEMASKALEEHRDGKTKKLGFDEI